MLLRAICFEGSRAVITAFRAQRLAERVSSLTTKMHRAHFSRELRCSLHGQSTELLIQRHHFICALNFAASGAGLFAPIRISGLIAIEALI